MSEKTKLKHLCPECKVNKWIVDYKEGCAADLTRHSICLFCQQGKEIEKLKKENMELKNKLHEISAFMTDMQKSNKELNDEIVNNGKDIHEIRGQLCNSTNFRKNENKGDTNASRKDEQFIKATGRRVTTRKTRQQPKNETATRNRFSLLSEQEEETLLIGDSMVRDQGEHFGLQNKRKRKVRSYPGASAKKIDEEVEKVKTESNRTTLIVQASGNDLFMRDGNAGQTEPLVKQLERTVETVQKKSDKAIVIGILPRLNVSHYALSKAIGINDRLETICKRHKVKFINLWDTFYGNRKMFRKDGIHFSEEGKRTFGNLINLKLYTHLGETTENSPRMQTTVVQGNE